MTADKVPTFQTRWRTALEEAFDTNDAVRLEEVVAQYHGTPDVAAYKNTPRDPLWWAIWYVSPWGVQHLVENKDRLGLTGVGLEHLSQFFVTLSKYEEDRHKEDARLLIGGVWPLLRPPMEAVSLRVFVLCEMIKSFPQNPEVARRHWHGLGMDAFCEGIIDTTFCLVDKTLPVTALQLAWLNNMPAAVGLILGAGASATIPRPDTVLPDWDLATATAERDMVCHRGDSATAINAYAQKRWASSSPDIIQTVGDAFQGICDNRSVWRDADRLVRSQVIHQALPMGADKPRGPRF